MTTTCDICGGELFRFMPPPGVRGIDLSRLPSICRKCGRVFVDGKALPLPPGLEEKIAPVADEAARHGREAREKLLGDPDARVEKYFDQVYRAAFVHGFSRALAYFSHHPKEGRLRRLRMLWDKARIAYSTSEALIQMDLGAFEEFCQLILMSAGARDAHA